MRMLYNFAAGKHPKAKITAVYTLHNPFAGIAQVEDTAPPKRALTLGEANCLMVAAEEAGQDLHFFVALGLHAGLRKAEILACRWEWIDWEHRKIQITTSHGFKPKHGRERYEPRRSFRNMVAAAGLLDEDGKPWVTPHLLRHSFASFLASGGVSLYKLSEPTFPIWTCLRPSRADPYHRK